MAVNTDNKKKNEQGTAGGRSLLYRSCRLCPRNCGVDRLDNKVGYCGETAKIKAARAALHFWEEPCISGYTDEGAPLENGEAIPGSGAIFFSGCNLRCVYCQNHEIAAGHHGKIFSPKRLCEIMLDLQSQGAVNLNLVTAVHFIPSILDALDLAKERGFALPVVYNTSGYESVETLKMLEGYVDIYLPDLKYTDSERSGRYSNATDYFEKAKEAIEEMVRQVGAPVFADDEKYGKIMKRGVIVRHLVLPGAVKEAKRIVTYLQEKYGDRIYVSILNQYTPMEKYLKNYPELCRRVTRREYGKVIDHVIEIGMEQVFIQDSDSASESFIPEFDTTGV